MRETFGLLISLSVIGGWVLLILTKHQAAKQHQDNHPWAKAMATTLVTFAVSLTAVTVLNINSSLVWPAFSERIAAAVAVLWIVFPYLYSLMLRARLKAEAHRKS